MNWKVMAVLAAALVASTSVASAYSVTILTSDSGGRGSHTDPNLINPWGLAHASAGPWIVADNGSAMASFLAADGTPRTQVINVPGDPTGVVYNPGQLTVANRSGSVSGTPAFIFASEDGTLSGWNPFVSQTQASVVVDNSGASAVYKGVAMARTANGERIYATDFYNARVDVFDGAFKPVNISGGFTDPNLPEGFAPFGIANIMGRIFVTYAKQDSAKHDDAPGAGFGYVDVFDVNGKLLSRVASGGALNAPWGLAKAPTNFGQYSNAILVGNFGDGRITAYGVTDDLLHVQELGQLADSVGAPISISGLWGIAFGNQGQAGPSNALYFTAGPNDEHDGLFGNITTGP